MPVVGRAKYKPHREGVRDLLMLPGLEPELLQVAEKVADRAKKLAPVKTGKYRDGIVARTVPGRSRRLAAEAIAMAPHSAGVEAKTRPLGRALWYSASSGGRAAKLDAKKG